MDRFDDVEFRILEEPEARRRPRRRTRLASLVTVTVAAGLFATSALAITDKPAAPQTPAKASSSRSAATTGASAAIATATAAAIENLGLRY